MKHVRIILGNVEASKITLDWPEYKLRPSEYIPIVRDHIKSLDDVVIRTCSSEIVNFVGALVEFWKIDADVLYDGKIHKYCPMGTLGGWAFDALHWYDDKLYGCCPV